MHPFTIVGKYNFFRTAFKEMWNVRLVKTVVANISQLQVLCGFEGRMSTWLRFPRRPFSYLPKRLFTVRMDTEAPGIVEASIREKVGLNFSKELPSRGLTSHM